MGVSWSIIGGAHSFLAIMADAQGLGIKISMRPALAERNNMVNRGCEAVASRKKACFSIEFLQFQGRWLRKPIHHGPELRRSAALGLHNVALAKLGVGLVSVLEVVWVTLVKLFIQD